MDPQSHLILTKKLLETCNQDSSSTIYSLIPSIDSQPLHLKGLFAHILENQPKIIESSIQVLTNKRTKSSYITDRLKEEEKNFRTILNRSLLKTDINKISDNKHSITLSILSHIYFDTFTKPIQFFLPHSSSTSAQFQFFEEIDYLKLKNYFYNNNTLEFQKQMLNHDIWEAKFSLKDFKPIVQKRLKKEKLLEQPLDVLSLTKAMIIRIGELSHPSINYEIIDYSIRNFLRQLNINKYLRVDREIEFLRKLETEIKTTLKDLI